MLSPVTMRFEFPILLSLSVLPSWEIESVLSRALGGRVIQFYAHILLTRTVSLHSHLSYYAGMSFGRELASLTHLLL